MKPVGSFSKLMGFGIAVAATLIVSSAQAAVGKAVVRNVSGTAEYSDTGGGWQTLQTGKVLGPGASVRSGVNSQVHLFLGDNGPDVYLLSDTTLGLEKLEIDRTGVDMVIQTMLNLQKGTIQGRVKKLAAASKYEVKTPYTVVGVREGEYQISADGKTSAIVGALMVVYTNPSTGGISTHTVNEGQTFVPPATPGQPGAVPIVSPTPPGLVTPLPGPTPPTPPPSVAVVPEPIQFVSPGTGETASQ
jgi:hypothetical protein